MCVHTNRARASASASALDAPIDCFRLSLARDFDLQRQGDVEMSKYDVS